MQLRTLLLTVALSLSPLTLTTLAAQQTPPPAATRQERDIVTVLRTQETAWNNGDIDTFAQGYKNSPDTLFIGNQVSRGYAGMIATYRRSYPNRAAMGTLSFSALEVRRLDDNFAVCIGKFHLERTPAVGGNANGIFTLVFEKTPQGWKIIIDHSAA